MRIFIDIGHPAHVHYFKNLVFEMQKQGHQFMISARNRDNIIDLLNALDLPYFNRGKGSPHLIGKLFYMLKCDYILLNKAKSFHPDIFLGFSSPYITHIAKIMKKKSIIYDDTEAAVFSRKCYKPFASKIYTPSFYMNTIGPNHIKFDGLMESSYLHPNYFNPDPSVNSLLGLNRDEKYIILRFIAWGAHHDIGHRGFSAEGKLEIINELSKHYRVFISSEYPLPQVMAPLRLKIPPEKIHDALYYANLFLGESGTMTTEAALLGTPAVRVSTIAKSLGNFRELRDKYKMLYFYDNAEQGLEKAIQLLAEDAKFKWKKKREEYYKKSIDVTQFMINSLLELGRK